MTRLLASTNNARISLGPLPSSRLRVFCGTLLSFALLTNSLPAIEAAQAVRSAQEVILKWSPQQRLYVKGDVGVGQNQLAKLEAWLDEYGAHWVVVLMQDADGERYASLDGRRFSGLDAVEYALGQGLSNQTDFGQWVNSQTGESDGCVLVIFLSDRKLSYFGSDAQDRRGLGESHWLGELDQPAIRAMRSGGRILDAVRDTVTSINTKLQATITREEAEKARQAVERERSLNELRTRIDGVHADLERVTAAAAELRERYPSAAGELADPPLNEWGEELTAAESELTADTVYQVTPQIASLGDRVGEYLNAYALARSLDKQEAEIEAQITLLSEQVSPVAQPMIKEATASLNEIRAARAAGRIDFVKHLASARQAVESGQRALAEEAVQQRQRAAQRRLIRNVAAGTSGALLAILGGFLMMLNRRREPAKAEALRVLAERQESVTREVDKVLELFDHSGQILGSLKRLDERGYEGRTRELGERTFESVDDLFVMSSEVERVMEEARQLVHPRDWFRKLRNLVSPIDYEKGIERISGKPLEFKRDRGLPMAMKPVRSVDATSPTNDSASSSDGTDPPEVIRLTFDEVYDNFHLRTEEATAILDKIEQSFLDVNDGLEALQEEINSISELERQLSDLSREHQRFAVPSFFNQLIPSAISDYNAGDTLALTDPVTAVERHIPEGRRKLSEARLLGQTLLEGHELLLPKLRKLAPLLEGAGFDAEWIDQRLDELSQRADQLFAESATTPTSTAIQEYATQVTGLGDRGQRCWELVQLLQSELEGLVEQSETRIRAGRDELAQRLNLPTVAVLHERPHDPDDHLRSASLQLEGIRAALQRGNVEAASEAVATLRLEVNQAGQILADSLQAERRFDGDWASRNEHWEATGDRSTRYQAVVAQAQRDYAASSLFFQVADPAFPNGNVTIDDYADQCRDQLAEVDRLLQRSREFYAQGRVLESAAMLAAIADDLSEVEQKYDEIDGHLERLRSREQENRETLRQLVAQIERDQEPMDDPRTTSSTLDFFRGWAGDVQTAASRMQTQTTSREPYAVAAALHQLKENATELDARLNADRAAYSEAQRAIAGAGEEAATGQRLIEQARRDGIPDNQTTTSLVQELKKLGDDLDRLRERLAAPHGDWKDLHHQAMKVHHRLGLATGRLRGELQIADQASAALESASRTVFEAAKWTGGWGVRIFGSPGSQELDRAREALQRADYAATRELSRAAALIANQAINRAQREVAQRQQEELRRAEAARRRRIESVPSVGSGGFGGGGGWSGGSSGRVSSGGGGSTSGFSRSGW